MSKKYSEDQLEYILDAYNYLVLASVALDESIDNTAGFHKEIDHISDELDKIGKMILQEIPETPFSEIDYKDQRKSLEYYYDGCHEIEEGTRVRQMINRLSNKQLTENDKETIEWAYKEMQISESFRDIVGSKKLQLD